MVRRFRLVLIYDLAKLLQLFLQFVDLELQRVDLFLIIRIGTGGRKRH